MYNELGTVLKLSVVSSINNLPDVLFTLTNFYFAGALGKGNLAAIGVGLAYFNVAWVAIEGSLTAHEMYSSRNKDQGFVRKWTLTALTISTFYAMLGSVFLGLSWFIIPLLFSNRSSVLTKSCAYASIMIPSLWALLLFRILEKYMQLQRNRQSSSSAAFICGIIGVIVNLVVSYLSMFWFQLGFAASPMSTGVARITSLISLLVYCKYTLWEDDYASLSESFHGYTTEWKLYWRRLNKLFGRNIKEKKEKHKDKESSSTRQTGKTDWSNKGTKAKRKKSKHKIFAAPTGEAKGGENDGELEMLIQTPDNGSTFSSPARRAKPGSAPNSIRNTPVKSSTSVAMALGEEEDRMLDKVRDSSVISTGENTTGNVSHVGDVEMGQMLDVDVLTRRKPPSPAVGHDQDEDDSKESDVLLPLVRSSEPSDLPTTGGHSTESEATEATSASESLHKHGHFRPLFDPLTKTYVFASLSGVLVMSVDHWWFDILPLLITSSMGTVPFDAVIVMIGISRVCHLLVTYPISVAVSVRLALNLDSSHINKVKDTLYIGFILGSLASMLYGGLIYLLGGWVSLVFTVDGDVQYRVWKLSWLIACFQVPYCLLEICKGVLRGLHRQRQIAGFGILSTYILHFVLSYLLTFFSDPPLGLMGYWIGIAVAVTMNFLVFFCLLLLTDWNREYRKAQIRLHYYHTGEYLDFGMPRIGSLSIGGFPRQKTKIDLYGDDFDDIERVELKLEEDFDNRKI